MTQGGNFVSALAAVGMAAVLLVGCIDGGSAAPRPPQGPTASGPGAPRLPQDPTSSAQPPSLRAPTRVPQPEVRGGGPLSGGDPKAVARINALLPTLGEDIQLSGSDAISYAQQVANLIPAMSRTFSAFFTGANCALSYGVLGVRAYVRPDLTAASAIVILSQGQLQQAPQIAARCLVAEVLGGGGTWNPCAKTYNFAAQVDGVADRYYVLIVSTTQACETIAAQHQRFSPSPGFGR